MPGRSIAGSDTAPPNQLSDIDARSGAWANDPRIPWLKRLPGSTQEGPLRIVVRTGRPAVSGVGAEAVAVAITPVE
jgi:hypothetical protein